MRCLLFLTIPTLLLTGCATSLSEGRATAILDAAAPKAAAHRTALLGTDLPEIRATGLDLLQVLSCARVECPAVPR